MATIPADHETCPNAATSASVSPLLGPLENLLDEATDHTFDADYYEQLEQHLKRVHAAIRAHYAIESLTATAPDAGYDRPEYAGERNRLRAEHSAMLGNLDRIIRAAAYIVDQPVEDKEVFILRLREFIATARRHEAEEERLLYLSLWRDTGGES